MCKVVIRGLLACGFALFIGGVRGTPPLMAAISDIVPSTPTEIDRYCRSLPGNGCPNNQLADPLCGDFCQEFPDLEPQEPREPGLPAEQICDDGIDNNGDGLIDCVDPDCASNPACQEICDDGIDNNWDLKIDCADPRCAFDPVCPENCTDGIDDDGDGDTDCEDLDCLGFRLCRFPLFPQPSFR